MFDKSHNKQFKILQKDFPRKPQMAPVSSLGPTLEPWCHQGRWLRTNLVPQGPPKRPILITMGTLRPNKYSKYNKKYSKSIDPKTQHEKNTIQDPPKLQKVWFTILKHTFSESSRIPKKSSKWFPNAPQMAPKSIQKSEGFLMWFLIHFGSKLIKIYQKAAGAFHISGVDGSKTRVQPKSDDLEFWRHFQDFGKNM